jgi:hypothetical protein
MDVVLVTASLAGLVQAAVTGTAAASTWSCERNPAYGHACRDKSCYHDASNARLHCRTSLSDTAETYVGPGQGAIE